MSARIGIAVCFKLRARGKGWLTAVRLRVSAAGLIAGSGDHSAAAADYHAFGP